jgi:hypothetical protein
MSFELHERKHLQDALTKIARRELRKTVRALTANDETVDGATGCLKVRLTEE